MTRSHTLERVDHLVFATPDIEIGVRQVEQELGVRAAPGGHHPAWGTRNALIGLGAASYLEILGPDPDSRARSNPGILRLDKLASPRLATWVVKGTDLEKVVREASYHGIELGAVQSGSRRQPDGTLLTWQLTDPLTHREDGLIPFFINWGASPHPAGTLPTHCHLVDLRAEHPEPTRIAKLLEAMGLMLTVQIGRAPGLVATVETAKGAVDLR